jgi:NAD(P)-dependent dehydrogenase (short-subunit alcohol dehydrogenase family)
MNYFEGKRVFITGGSSGIGLEAACMLASSGAEVAVFARDPGRLEAARKRIEAARARGEQRVYELSMDVSDNDDVQEKVEVAVAAFGVPDILINSAGVGHADYFESTSFETFDGVIRANLYGTRNVVAALVGHMKERGGHIANVSSMLGLVGMFGYSSYCSSKYALVGLSECLRMDLKRYGIGVSVFCPPEVDTPMTDYMLEMSPPETRAGVRMNGIISSRKAAAELLEGIEKDKFLILAGTLSKWSYLAKRFFPGLTRTVVDAVVERAAGKHK